VRVEYGIAKYSWGGDLDVPETRNVIDSRATHDGAGSLFHWDGAGIDVSFTRVFDGENRYSRSGKLS